MWTIKWSSSNEYQDGLPYMGKDRYSETYWSHVPVMEFDSHLLAAAEMHRQRGYIEGLCGKVVLSYRAEGRR